MMQGVAVGWQIYDLTNDPLDLGLVGLVQFFPIVAMSIIAGQLLDLFDRRIVAGVCQVGKALAALCLAVGTAQGWLGREAMFAILFLSGTARAFEIPTMHSLLPGIVPTTLLPRAIAASATAQQTAVICGPSLGGPDVRRLRTHRGLCDLHRRLHRGERAGQPRQDHAAHRGTQVGQYRDAVRRIWLRPQPSDSARRDLARPVRRAARRRDRAVADLCPRHPRGRPLGARPVALGASGRRPGDVDRADASRDRGKGRADHVCGGRHVRSCELCLRAVDIHRAFVPRAHGLRRLRRGQRGHPAIARADAHALRHARPRDGGQLDVHRLIGHARRIPGRAWSRPGSARCRRR